MLERYKHFVRERHAVWEARQAGLEGPWTEDPIIAGRKFCNMFRVLDHGSQYVVRELLDGDEVDTLLRIFLYRFTNRPEPWEFFSVLYDRAPTLGDLATDALLSTWSAYNGPIFSPAYRINVDRTWDGTKLDWLIFRAKEVFIHQKYFSLEAFFSGSPEEQHEMLMKVPRSGPFMAMQILTDWNYSKHGYDGENDFIVPGPGAIRGAERLDPDEDPTTIIYGLTAMWRKISDVPGIPLPGGGSRGLSLMDVQNTLCEYDKYCREIDRAATFKPYDPKNKTVPPVLPAHWKGTE